MNIIDTKPLLTPGEHSLLKSYAAKLFNLGGFNSLDDILTRLDVDVIIEPGILKRTTPSYFDDAFKYWMELGKRIREELKKVKTFSKQKKLKEELEKVGIIIQCILPRDKEYWSSMPIRGLYVPDENVIKLYPEEMHNEYGGARMDELLVSTLAHETMHAYFNRPSHRYSYYIPTVEEPLAEFGMLLYLNDTHSSYYNWAYDDVKGKRTSYKYGADLMDQYLKESSPYPTHQYLEEYKFKMRGYPVVMEKGGKIVTITSKEKGVGIDETPIGKGKTSRKFSLPIAPPPMPYPSTVKPTRKIVVQEKYICNFVLKVFIYLEGEGLLGKLATYIEDYSSDMVTLVDGGFLLRNVLANNTITLNRNDDWNTNYPFVISGNTYFLSKEWRNGGKTHQGLQFDQFVEMIKSVYGYNIAKASDEFILIV